MARDTPPFPPGREVDERANNMNEVKALPIFEKEQEIYDLVLNELESDNPRLSREILLGYKEHFEELGVMLYSPLTLSIMTKILEPNEDGVWYV